MIPGSASPFFLGSSLAVGGGGGGYQIERSLRFNSSDSAYLSRTPAVAGNRRTWTWAGWVKRSALGSAQNLFRGGAGTSNSTYVALYFANDDIKFGGWVSNFITTTAVFRDCSAWYHIVLTVDTTLTTNRIKLYVNNVEQTITQDGGYPAQNDDLGVNLNQLHTIGGNDLASGYANHYLADIHFIDGQALTPSSFTEVSATTGQLIPKAYAGTYTGNSFWLKFNDNSATTAATLGKDSFLLGNNWTPNNLSVTAGAGNDSLVDTPTSYGTDTSGVGGVVRGNYATFNTLILGTSTTTNGNLEGTNPGSVRRLRSTIGASSGKWYWEVVHTGGSAGSIGVIDIGAVLTTDEFVASNTSTYYNAGAIYVNGSTAISGASYNNSDVIGIALNVDSNQVSYYKNGSLQQTVTINSGVTWAAMCGQGSSTQSQVYTINFGQRAFAYQTPGTNRPAATFLALCDTNLGAPLVALPSTVFNVITYTGTGSSLTLPNGSSTPTSISFTPDFAWIKGRSGATDHAIYDAVRDVEKDLVSNSSAAETTQTTGLTAFGTNTFTVGSLAKLNTSSSTYVAWCWDAGTTTDPSNQAGSITSQVRANVSAGFSVVTWTAGTGVYTVGHGLGVKPAMIIHKCRSNAEGWLVRHVSIGDSGWLVLNSTAAASTLAYGGTNTSTVFYNQDTVTTSSGRTMVAYCFAPVVGYSSMGSYVGNGSSDGPFVYTGFRPRFVLVKLSSAAGNPWLIFDSARSTYNVVGNKLAPNSSVVEDDASIGNSTQNTVDFLSNGFKPRTADNGTNGSSQTYIFAAFAENPFQYARAR